MPILHKPKVQEDDNMNVIETQALMCVRCCHSYARRRGMLLFAEKTISHLDSSMCAC